jgi:hypothetical protein
LLGYKAPKDFRDVLSFKARVLIVNSPILSMLESADVKPLQGEIPPQAFLPAILASKRFRNLDEGGNLI